MSCFARSFSLLVLLAVVACDGSAAKPAAAPAPQASAPTWAGSQEELARAIDVAANSVEPSALREVQRRWQGQRVRWTVARVAPLCGADGPCYVQPFSSARRSEAGAHGWLPELTFAAGERERLVAECGARELCQVTVEGLVESLVVSDELPTSIRLGQVRVASVDEA